MNMEENKAKINRKNWNKCCFGKSVWLSIFEVQCDYLRYSESYLYLLTRWWMKTQISSLARFIPGHIRGPLPNPRKLKGLNVSCNWMKISNLKSLEIEMIIKVSCQEGTYIKSRGIKLFRILENFWVVVNRNNI